MKLLGCIIFTFLCMNLAADPQVVLVTGSSKGIGKAICEQLAKRGHIVYGSMRHPEKFTGFSHDSIKVKKIDVCNSTQIESAISEIISEQGRIDVIVNNAGYLLLGPCELIELDQMKSAFETNFYGAVRVMQAALPQMRAQKRGHIINISSTSGFDPSIGFDAHAATKFALEGLSGAMAAYLTEFGIKLSLIEPGPVETEILSAAQLGTRQLDPNPYQNFQHNLLASLKAKVAKGQPAQEIAELVDKVIAQEQPKLRYQTSLSGVQSAQKNLVDTTGISTLAGKQIQSQELFSKVGE